MMFRFSQHTVFTLTSLLLVALCSRLAVQGAYTYLEGKLETIETSYQYIPPISAEKPVLPPTQVSVQSILDRNIFGVPAVSSGPIDTEALDRTVLDLKLWGTIVGPGNSSRAVIEAGKTGVQHLLRSDEQIQNARIVAIFPEKVILEVDGNREILEMQKWQGSASSPAIPGVAVTGESRNRLHLKRSQVDEAVQDINNLMKQVRIIPHFTEGKPDGLRITGIQTGSFFNRIGLQSGDIVLGVDGKPIESVDDALKIYTGLKTADAVRLDLRRANREQTIEYEIE